VGMLVLEREEPSFGGNVERFEGNEGRFEGKQRKKENEERRAPGNESDFGFEKTEEKWWLETEGHQS